MLCEICMKNEATIHIQEIINKQKKTLHICQECAAKKSMANGILDATDLAKFLYNITSNFGDASGILPGHKKGTPVFPELLCPDCGWDTAKFAKTGRLGCAKCYAVFKDLLVPALKNMHKGIIHVGKTPVISQVSETTKKSKEPSITARIKELQKQLEECVQNEEFEKAACLRDEIADLKKRLKEKPT